MNADAQKLIRLLEQECKSLSRFIAQDLKEEDYNLAHAHDRALHRAQHKLRVLRNLEDQNSEQKEFLKLIVGRFPRVRDHDDWYESEYMREKEAELANLEQGGPVPVPESDLLARQLRFLVVGMVKAINIVLSRRDDLSLQLRHQKRCIKISIPDLERLRRTGVIGKARSEKLVTMGFNSVSDNRLEMRFARNDETHARIMTLLSRIVFDILHYRDFAGQSFIEVVNE